MTRVFAILGAFGTIFLTIWTTIKGFGRSQKKLGAEIERTNQLSEAIGNVEEGKRIQDQLDKDLAALSPDARARLLRDKYTRH